MIAFPRVRSLATLGLALSLALPAYTCDGYRAPGGDLVDQIPAGADSAAYTPARVPHRPVTDLEPLDLEWWGSVLAYTWPLLLLGARARWPGKRIDRALHWGELIVPLGAVFMIVKIAMIGETAYGTYVALSANALLWVTAILEFVRRRRASAPNRAAT